MNLEGGRENIEVSVNKYFGIEITKVEIYENV